MSDGEIFMSFACLVAAFTGWMIWSCRVIRISTFISPRRARRSLLLGPILAHAVLLAILVTFSASDVRSDLRYIAMYLAIGSAWVILCQLGLSIMGMRVIEDVAQRRNPAAAWAVTGFFVGPALCYAGGNIGDGPGWWVVLFAAFYATISWFVILFAIDQICGIFDDVFVGRDPAAGVRLMGTSIALGLILGRGVAGTWVSAAATLDDFARDAWPALIIAGFEICATFLFRVARGTHPTLPASAGFLAAILSVGGAITYVIMLGWWA